LRWKGKPLTSEIVRAEADAAVLRAGGIPGGTIIAGGRQACDPHDRGSGPLRAHELIIIDIFPRDARSGYFGDLTRTVVKGRASEEQRRMWQTVVAAQRLAMRAIKPGVRGAGVHRAVQEFFVARGYPTAQKRGRWTGFFHGTGHGLGLDLHEEPRIAATVFRLGQVFTVEPGLYYPGIGGARHEDVVVVTKTGGRQLSRVPLPLELA
jgi:Xaa-Pro aminopeptidase